MLCEKVIGSIKDEKYKNYKVDYVNIEWHDAFKKIHKHKPLPTPKTYNPQ